MKKVAIDAVEAAFDNAIGQLVNGSKNPLALVEFTLGSPINGVDINLKCEVTARFVDAEKENHE